MFHDIWCLCLQVEEPASPCRGGCRKCWCFTISDVCVCRLKSLLLRVEEDVESACLLQEEEENCEPTFAHVPWSNLVSLCVDYRLDSLDLTDPDAVSEKVRKTWHWQRFSVMFALSVELLVQLPLTAGVCEEAVSWMCSKEASTGEPRNTGLWTDCQDIT